MMECPGCQCREFYAEKAFPKKTGLAIVIVAIVASFWTYGLSLIAAALIDGLLYKFIPNQLVCYRCRHIFKNVPIPDTVQGYDPHKAELYESLLN